MPVPQRPTVPRLSSTYIKNLTIDDRHILRLDDSDIPSCGVEILPRSRHIDDDDTSIQFISTKNQPPKLRMTIKADNDDDSIEAASHRNPIEERQQKMKSARQSKGREFAKEQRKKRSLEAIKVKEDAEQEKIMKAERLLALGRKARKFAGEPLPEFPRQQLAKSRMKVKRKNEVYVPPEEDENDVSTYALQWALGTEEIDVEADINKSKSIDFRRTTEKDGREYSTESKGGEGNFRYFEDNSLNDSDINNDDTAAHINDRYNHDNQRYLFGTSGSIAESFKSSVQSNTKNVDSDTGMRYSTHESKPNSTERGKSIFDQGLVNNMGRITARISTIPSNEKLRNEQGRNDQKQPQPIKKSPVAPTIKMFSPSYKQEMTVSKSHKTKKETTTPESKGSNSTGRLDLAAISHKNSTSSAPRVIRIDVRDTKGNIVRQLERPASMPNRGLRTGLLDS